MHLHWERHIINLLLAAGSYQKQPSEATENGICKYAQIDAWH